MNDPRIDRLAGVLLDHSCRLKPGENILIEAIDLPDPALVCALVEGAAARGGVPLVTCKQQAVLRSLYRNATKEGMLLAGEFERARMAKMDAYIGVRGAANASQLSDVPAERMDLYQKHWWHAVHSEVRVPKTKWVVLRYPTDSFAQAANMSTAAFEDFYFDVCTADYAAMGEAQKPLVARMEAADRVRIVAPGTELEFSIKGIPVIPCNGERNIPDGEVFTAPVRDSVNGVIRFNTQSRYQGTVFSDIMFEFKDGKIVNATSSDTTRINQILDSDAGARYIGEWSMGTNNRVRHPMLDTLFDEKIGGSFHLTPGNAYDIADNGNDSVVHWDLVLIQRPDYGGGEIWFDGELLRKDGRFVPKDLQGLNEGL
ncbi:Aminopeptidase 2 [Pirellulimonas nuda]|uniref:Aminopeptidase 2 n=1 Tax=Pirellulimonas nuda TaxID=2528009 RepID=A0A518DHB1_9BACT|nr:aminopeptidase [Pirellulimonas nuda]QDU90832.1 Aminopeptidase 2 [Pirellulimonas nuda]